MSISTDDTPSSYYADLNPRYGARNERRWAVFHRRGANDTTQTTLHYVTRKAAERAAVKIMAQERDGETV